MTQPEIRGHFKNPPVSEVACGIGFIPPPRLTGEAISRYRDKISDRYPHCETTAPLPQPDLPFMFTAAARPGMLFRTAAGNRILQIQPHSFSFNWVRATGGGENPPHFHPAVHALEIELEAFQSHLDDSGIGKIEAFQHFSLKYINHIPRSDGWTTRDELRLFLPDFFAAWPTHTKLREPCDISIKFSQNLEFGRLDVSVGNGQAQKGPEEIFIVEMSVASPPGSKALDSVRAWFDEANEAIVATFTQLISHDAGKKWGVY
jgi:uncharacterized protein (TIGR04255 family)